MQILDNKDIEHKDEPTFGFFDGYYNVANKANFFLSTEINYALPFETKNFKSPMLYSTYSRYFKDEAGYADSEHLINGVYTKYKENFQFYFEYINAKNNVGFDQAYGFIQGTKNKRNNLLFLSLGYYF